MVQRYRNNKVVRSVGDVSRAVSEKKCITGKNDMPNFLPCYWRAAGTMLRPARQQCLVPPSPLKAGAAPEGVE